MLTLLNSYAIVFRQYQKKYFIFQIEFISSVAYSNKCLEFYFISLFIFLSKQKALYKHNFLECAFQIKM